MPTMTAGTPWGHTTRPWGYEIRVDFTDENGQIYNECLTFRAVPTPAQLDDAIATRKAALEYVPPPDFVVESEDGTEVPV